MSTLEDLDRCDEALAKVATALVEARGNGEMANVAICEQRRDELLDERLLILAAIPRQRQGD